jgi:hypothetical protein
MEFRVPGNCEKCGSNVLVAARFGTEGAFSGYCPICHTVWSGAIYISVQPPAPPAPTIASN